MKWRWSIGLAAGLATAALAALWWGAKPPAKAGPDGTNSVPGKTNVVASAANRQGGTPPANVPTPLRPDKRSANAAATNLARLRSSPPATTSALRTNPVAKTNLPVRTAAVLSPNKPGQLANTNAAAATTGGSVGRWLKSLSGISYYWYGLAGLLLMLGGAYGLFRWRQAEKASAPALGPAVRITGQPAHPPSGMPAADGWPSSGGVTAPISAGQEALGGSPPSAGSPLPSPAVVKRRKASAKLRFASCNVLRFGSGVHQLWQFNVAGTEVSLHLERVATNAESLPKKAIIKNAQALWRPRLNVLWLPPEQVYLRVVHLPASEAEEIPAMVELQLERLSPMPVAQVVWSYEVVVQSTSQPQTIIVLVAPRNLVEEFLGRLEGQGYLADRLELPQLHQLLTTPIDGDGVWFYPDPGGLPPTCLVAWWHGNMLRQVNCLRLPTTEDWSGIVTRQLTQIAWAGEMEGWLTSSPPCRLAADARTAEQWKPILEEWSGQPVQLLPAIEPRELAALNVQRLAKNQAQANLLPLEFATRYRQQFIDSLWMGGLGALLVAYLAGLFLYFAAVQVTNFQRGRVDAALAKLKPKYTAALQTKARIQVMQEQMNLKYAGLECWKAAAELLPPNLTLTDLSLQQGKTLTLHGSAPSNEVNAILEYNRNLSQHRPAGTNANTLFSSVRAPNSRLQPVAGGELTYSWDFSCELRQQY